MGLCNWLDNRKIFFSFSAKVKKSLGGKSVNCNGNRCGCYACRLVPLRVCDYRVSFLYKLLKSDACFLCVNVGERCSLV